MADRAQETIIRLQWGGMVNVRTMGVYITIPIVILFNITPDLLSRHSVLAFIFPALLTFLQIKTGFTRPSAFQVHPLTTTTSVIGVLGYYLLFGAKRCLPTYAPYLNSAMSVLGSFSVASLASLLLLPPSLWNIRFVFYVMFMLPELLPLLKKIFGRYVHRRQQPMGRRGATPSLLPRTYADLTGLRY